MVEKSIANLRETLTRFIEGQKRPSSGVFSRERPEAEKGTGIIISIKEDPTYDHHKDLAEGASFIMVITMALDNYFQTSH